MKKIVDITVKFPVLITAILCVVFYFLPFKPMPFGDLDQVHIGIQQVIKFILNGFSGDVNVEKGFLTLVLYVIPYSFVYPFHNDNLFLLSGIIFNCLFTCFSIYYLFKAFDLMLFSKVTKFYVLILLCSFPIHIYYAMGVLGESFAFFSASFFVYIWVKIVKKIDNSALDYFLLGLSLVLLYGIKPNMLPFVIIFSIILIFNQSTLNKKVAYLASVSIIVLLIVIERNLDKSDFEFKRTVFRNQILWSRFELRDEPFYWIPQHTRDEYASSDYFNNLKKRKELDSIATSLKVDKTKYFISWVINDIKNNPFLTARQYALKFFQSQSFIISPLIKSNKSMFTKWSIHVYINIINYILIITALFSVYLLFKNKKIKIFLPLLMLWCWSLAYVFVFHSEQRYMFPSRPVVIFLSAYVLNFWIEKRNLKANSLTLC